MWHARHPRTAARSRPAPASSDRLLITGTRGAGKRPVGNYLAIEHGYLHLDFDDPETRARFVGSGPRALRAGIEALAGSRKVVVTWELASPEQLASIGALRRLGFDWIWFDSDRGSASGGLVAGGTRAGGPRFVDTFAPDGGFRPLEPVVEEILRRPTPETQRTRSRTGALVPALRWQLAGALALAATAAAAGGAYLLGGLESGSTTPRPIIAASARPAALPSHGVLVPGRSLAGVHLGDTKQVVRSRWGKNFTVCKVCTPTTWLFLPPRGEGSGAAVSFRGNKVTIVRTLGSPRGWRTSDGLKVGQLLEQFNDPSDTSRWQYCPGYGAKSTRSSEAVTSILTIGQSVYGFALTRPTESVCL